MSLSRQPATASNEGAPSAAAGLAADAARPPKPPLGPRGAEALVKSSADPRPAGLSPEEERVVEAMAARDREVRDHEEAHARVGREHAGQPRYDFETGPDGARYAVAGSVAIDVSPVADDPAATIDKMEIVKAAALAPAEPSGADRQVAAKADAIRAEATAELNAQRLAETRDALRGDEGERGALADPARDDRQPRSSPISLKV